MKEYHTTYNLSITSEQKLLFKKPGLQNRVIDKLKRGQLPIQEECDLHGLTTIEAEHMLCAFLENCCRQHLYCIRIIHGKGHGSLGQFPILKNFVYEWLKQKDSVLAFCSAKPNDGGAGALYVLLKKT